MRRKIAFGAAAAIVAALVVSNPIVADAARRIGGEDIRNGSIESRDIKNRTLKSKDIANDNLKSWDVKDSTLKGKDVRDGSLTADDFKAGTLPVTAYARVIAGATGGALDDARSQNIASVTRTADGVYCLELKAGVDRTVAVLAQAEGGDANETAQWSGNCGANGVQVTTQEQGIATGGTALNSNPSNHTSFSVLVP
ncbi:MAG TPA: hypothetical protein VFH10_02395 [Nocardioides sp.]|uniref:hypothetical protein n=1 Tax=Nocardioides sp. TaxID=35761 RepID=UPI002D7EC6CD|nr:hypothetical protein [Nocardioides sp.]HET6651460.1 hypothetical protein [Nocardioides sp.]